MAGLAMTDGGSTPKNSAATKQSLEAAIAVLKSNRDAVVAAKKNKVQALDFLVYVTRYRILKGGKDIGNTWAKKANFLRYVTNDAGWSEISPVFTEEALTSITAGLNTQISTLQSQLNSLPKDPTPTVNTPVAKTDDKKKDKDKKKVKGKFIYNVAGVKEAYFTSERGVMGPKSSDTGVKIAKIADTTVSAASDLVNTGPKDTLYSSDGNKPVGDISDVMKLWADSRNHKGMITKWDAPNNAGVPGSDTVSGVNGGTVDNNRYAFQFHYNPQPITMQYVGAPPIDVTMFTSGTEDFAPYTGGNGAGTINFELVLNRINDMKYYRNGALIKKNVYATRDPYGKDAPKTLFNEQETIYNRGTMYDVEFFLRTVLGITIESKYRGKTADFGWIGAMPVEVHLGPGLRYWATVSAFTINHVIFNERMVPVFSTVNITVNRIPDYVTMPQSSASSSSTSTSGVSSVIRTDSKGNKYIQGKGGRMLVN